ncbi:MAG TPA: PKD domain-containing protein [Candidatus Humimicrobiaceae bacterium]
MGKTIKIIKLAAICFVVFVFSFSLVILPAVKDLSAAGNGIKVFIDAGHGGKDPGAVANGLNEKDANIAIANRLKAKLEAGGFTVIMRRAGDQYHSLDEIVNMANGSGADIFISIHNNASVSASANGTETYWNANGVNGSSQLASLVQSRLLSQIGRANRGVKTADFRVIKYTRMPAALVECSFVSNPTEAALLKTADFQEKCATGLFNAINEFSKGINKDTGSYTGGSGNSSAGFTVIIDYPGNNATIDKNFPISGWAADLNNKPPKKLARVEIFKGSERNTSNFIGTASRFDRPDLGRKDILDSGYLLNISLDSLVKGENILYVYAYDANGNYTYNMVKINVIKEGAPTEQPNSNPVANPAGPYQGTVNEAITFNGSASTDSDGSITEYIWDFGDGSSGSTANPVHTYASSGVYTVKLTVKDNKNAQSAAVQVSATISEEDEETGQEEGQEGTSGDESVSISNSTIVIGYKEATVEQLVKLFIDRNSNKVERARRLAVLYIQYGKLFNIRADIAWAQMSHETGFLEFTGDVKPEQNNFCGMGAVGAGVPGNSFATEELGVIAHYAHLSWYYYQNHKNEYCNNQYDPRHFENTHNRYTGDTTLGFLNGRWAPGSTYTNKIVLFANEVWQGTDIIEHTVTANAGQDLIADVGEELTFDASGSVISPLAEAGTITYSWDWNSDGVYDATTENSVIKHAFNSEGTFNVKLEVTAFENIKSTDIVLVSINAIPTANPGGPYEGTVNEAITLDGSASTDSDGTITEYSWNFGDNSTGTGVKPAHTYTVAGTYTVTLTVKDDKEASSISEHTTVIITQEGQEPEDGEEESEETAENIIPIASPGGPYTGTAGKERTFDGSASVDSDGSITEYNWNFGDNSTGTGAKPVHTYAAAGTYTVTLTVKDNSGASSDAKTTTVTVTVEVKIVVSREIGRYSGVFTMVIDTPRNNESISQDFVFSGWAADLVNKKPVKLAKVEIYNGRDRYEHNFLGTASIFQRPDLGRKDILDSGYSLRISLKSLMAGENTLWVYAYDASNNYSLTAVKINVIKEASGDGGDGNEVTVENVKPTANLGGPYTATAGKEMTFDGSASTDSDGSIAEYTWNFGDNSTGTGAKPVHTYAAAGTYTVTLTVKDNSGASSDAKTTTATVTVETSGSSGQSYPVNTTPISNSTSVIGYTEVTVDQLVKIFTDRNSSKVDWARRIAPIYINYGKLFNIRADIAWAQMCHETGFLEYTGDVRPNQNNFSGMGATGGGVPGNSFATEELGIIAHYAHLSWYYYQNHINNYCNNQYDPRHFGSSHYKYTGNTTLGFLNGNWAPGSTYTDKIILFANRIYGF